MTRTAMYNNYVRSVQFAQSTVLCTQNNDLQAQYSHNYVHDDVLFAQSTALYTDSNDAQCKHQSTCALMIMYITARLLYKAGYCLEPAH